MSGGIDSTYAALKLIDGGHDVTGAILVMHEYTDVSAAERAAARLGINLVKIDCTRQFDEAVKSYFINEYTHARTPNPCIVCNREVKFRYLYEYAVKNGFDKIATGHYARIVTVDTPDGTRYATAAARDCSKDQTYMLYRLPQEVLGMLVLPLSDDVKSEVVLSATARGIKEEGQKESQEICFIPDDDYRGYIESRVGKFPEGSFIDREGRVLGTHKGIISYTVGQRKGLGISLGERAFVTGIDPLNNTVTVDTAPPLCDKIEVSSLVYSGMAEQPVGTEFRASVKIRYKAKAASATVRIKDCASAEITFDEPAALVAPGQSAVVYRDGVVLLGGFIN